MFPSEIPQFNIDELTGLSNNNYCGGSFGFDEFNHLDPSNVAGPSNIYAGSDVLGNFNNYPDYPTAPTPLDVTHGLYPYEGYPPSLYQGTIVPSLSQPTAAPHQVSSYSPLVPSPVVPNPPHGSLSISPGLYTVPTIHTSDEFPQPQAIINPGGLGFGFPVAAESRSMPLADPTLAYGPTWEELWSQSPPLDPLLPDLPPSDSVVVERAAPPEVPLPVPTESLSGAERTRQWVREMRRYGSLRTAKKEKVDTNSGGWYQTLIRFRDHFDTVYNVHYGQPSGGLKPEAALARINKYAKEDLERSPLRNKKAGEGKRPRDVETYLGALLQAIRQTDPALLPTQGGLEEGSTIIANLSWLADELESRLVAVNPKPTLRQSTSVEVGEQVEQPEGKRKRSESEKARRISGRYHVQRMSLLFRSEKTWSKKDLFGFAVLFLLYGPTAFPKGFVQVRDTPTGL